MSGARSGGVSSGVSSDTSTTRSAGSSTRIRTSRTTGTSNRKQLFPRARRRRLPSSAASSSSLQQHLQRRRRLSPPFPNGLCGGSLVVLPPEQTYGYTAEDNAYLTAAASLLRSGGDGDGGGGADAVNVDAATSLLLPPRPITVWLPPSYEASGRKRHRVIYVHDGQNAIDDEDSWTGSSWRMAGALTRLAERGALGTCTGDDCDDCDIDPLPLLVLLPSADGDVVPGMRRRHLEYGDGVFGARHADFVAGTVLPLVNDRFRTVATPEGTVAIGSSLGGQAALHLLLRHPTLFGGAACLSPAFQPATIAAVAAAGPDLLRHKRIYIDNGGDDADADGTPVRVPWFDVFDHLTPRAQWNPGYFWLDTQLQPSIDAMRTTLDFHKVRYEYRKFPGGRHNEREWSRRIDGPLMYLLGGQEEEEEENGRSTATEL